MHSDQESDGDSTTRRAAANGSGAISKSARAYAKTYTLGAPPVPALLVDKVMQYVNRISITKKLAFVQMACRYWSLKREARRGAPLLKRLYLEVRIRASMEPLLRRCHSSHGQAPQLTRRCLEMKEQSGFE